MLTDSSMGTPARRPCLRAAIPDSSVIFQKMRETFQRCQRPVNDPGRSVDVLSTFSRFLHMKGLVGGPRFTVCLFGEDTSSMLLPKWDVFFKLNVIKEAKRLISTPELRRWCSRQKVLQEVIFMGSKYLNVPTQINMDSPVKAQKARVAMVPAAAPDGGYAWFILLSCFLVFGLTFGVIKAFGVFYVEIHQYFGTTATETSWITSIAVAVIHFVAPVASALSARYSHRSVVTMGGLICSVGVVLGAFARNLIELYLTVGFLNGFGYAITWTPTVTMLGMYFEKRRPVANALASAGECILTFILTPLFQLLIDSYSWRGAFLVLGGLQLNLCVCGMLLRPLKTTRDVTCAVKAEEEGLSLELLPKDDLEQSKPSCSEELRISEGSDHDPEEIPNSPVKVQDSNNRTKRPELRTKILRYLDYTLIGNAQFMVYSMFGVFAALSFFAPALFLVPYARSKGIEEYQAAALMSISAALDLFGRVFFGWVANLRLVETVQQLTASVILQAVVLLLCPLASSFLELAAFSAVYGLVYGATVAVHITVLAEVVGVSRLGSALGFFMLIRSSGGLLGPPIAGVFIDKMNDYGTGFLVAGVALIVCALFLLLLHQMNRRGQRLTTKNRMHTDKMEQSAKAKAKELDMT